MLSKTRLLGLGAIISAAVVLSACDGRSSNAREEDDDSDSTESSGNGAASTGTSSGGNDAGGSGAGGGNTPCDDASDCDDQDACTDDACNANCSNTPIDVDDQDACTTDSCDPVSGISHVALDPDDQDACTVDSCDAETGVSNVGIDLDDGDLCTADSCDAVTGIAHVAIDPDDTNPCTLDTCDPATGASNLAELTLFSEGFADNSQGWVVGPEWMIGSATASTDGAYGADPASDHTFTSDNGVAGAIIGGNVSTAQHDYYYLISPAIDATSEGHLTLSYWRWLNSDYTPFMKNRVQVFDGSQWQPLWESDADPGVQDSPPHGSGWVQYRHEITDYANSALKVRFGYNVAGTDVFTIGGWNIDDVAVLNAAVPADDDACTVDSCDPIQGAQYAPVTTNDQNACTTDACTNVLAVHHPAIDPNDGNACTTDNCNPQSGISNTPLVCNDQDACTTNSCNMLLGCVFTVLPQPHDKCDTNAPNTPLINCPSDSCVPQVCAVDPSCCNSDWDADCVNQVFSVCDNKSCNASAGTCAQSLCTTSSTPLVSGCDANFGNCVATVCAADSWCCTNGWDQQCVDEVTSLCSYSCD